MKRLTIGRILSIALLMPLTVASAQDDAQLGLCSVDAAPASTLLFPELRVDASDPAGLLTIYTIANASPQSVIAHVTLWADGGVPVFDYDIYLTGWDVVTWDLRDSFHNLNLPRTAESVSPHGPWSDPPTSIPACSTILPFDNPAIGIALGERFRSAVTGSPSDFDNGLCLGSPPDDSITSAYVTVDLVNQCNLLFPSTGGYWKGVASYESVLVGSYRVIDPAGRSIDRPAIHLQAAGPGFFGPGDRSWGQRWLQGAGLDRREPLPSRWAVRFDDSNDSILHAWRSGEASSVNPFECGTTPPNLPLPTAPTLVFDDEENPLELQIDLPWEVNEVDLEATLPLAGPGWMILDLRHEQGIPAVGDQAQASIYVVSSTPTSSSVSEGWPLDDNCPQYVLDAPSVTAIFVDGFERGNCDAWLACPSS